MTPRNQERIFPKDSAPGFGYELTQLSDFATRRWLWLDNMNERA
jgi:hypothetical protein